MGKITIYKNLFDSQGVAHHVDIEKAFYRIKTGSNKDLVEKIRKEKDKGKRNEFKSKLHCYLFSGEFSQRKDDALISHSGFICLDFDGYKKRSELLEWKDKIKIDKHTYSVFISPSGNGLKVIVQIPPCTKEDHKLYFKALEAYYDTDYFDSSCKNISRVCYESYDAEIYVNKEAEIWKEKYEEEGYKYVEKVPELVLNDESQIINKLMVWWNKNFGLVEGSKNNNLFVLASSFNEYGINKAVTESYFINHIVCGTAPDAEINLLIRSAYKNSGAHGTKYFEDIKSMKDVEVQLLRGHSKHDIASSVSKKHDLSPVDSLDLVSKIEDKRSSLVFWIYDQKKDKITIDNMRFKDFLQSNGFYKYYADGVNSPIFVYIKSNIVTTSSIDKIKDFVLTDLMERGESKVWNFLTSRLSYFTENYLSMIDSINLLILKDDKQKCFLYYKNGVVQITKKDLKIIDYIDVNGYVWEDHIIDREFKTCENPSNDFQDLVFKVCQEDAQRAQIFEATLGYLMHSYKDLSHQKAIIFNDQEINEDPNGGSGKSLILNGLSKFKKLVKINGKKFDNNSDFAYQRVSVDTQILAFDDVKRNFDFESLFSLITEGIDVNKKNKDEIYISFENSPKIVITTNYVINGAGSSHQRRRHEIELFQYFNERRQPIDVYGKMLFSEWSEIDWTAFDNYMIKNVQLFLSKGLLEPISINADVKRLIQNTSKDFYDWIEDGNIEFNSKVRLSDSLEKFLREYKSYNFLTTKKYKIWIKRYADFMKWKVEDGKDHTGRYILINNKQPQENKTIKELGL